MRSSFLIVLIASAAGAGVGAELNPQTVAAFDAYVRAAEARIDHELSGETGAIWANTPERRAQLRRSDIVSEPRTGRGETSVQGGLVHDWIGAVYIPRATVENVLATVQNYDRHKQLYKPEVLDSHTVDRSGNDFRISLRLFKHKVISVILNTEHDVHYRQLGPKRWRAVSASTRIAQVKDAGKKTERELPPGRDQGFLWRLNSYWTFFEQDGGTYVELEAVSLARDIPRGLAWLIAPIIRELPRQSLANTLACTRAAMTPAQQDSAAATPITRP